MSFKSIFQYSLKFLVALQLMYKSNTSFVQSTNLLVSERAAKCRKHKMLQHENWLNIHNIVQSVNTFRSNLKVT